MANHLVISAMGQDRAHIVHDLSRAIRDSGANIQDSRMTVLGGEFALILMVSGDEAVIAKLQTSLAELQVPLGLTIISRPTEPPPVRNSGFPYRIRVVALDHPGLVHDIAEFFSHRDINIEKIDTETYHAAHTGTAMFGLAMAVSVPAQINTTQLREAFADFCEQLNIDGQILPITEPKKGVSALAEDRQP